MNSKCINCLRLG